MPRRRLYSSSTGQYAVYINIAVASSSQATATIFRVPSLPEQYQLIAEIVQVETTTLTSFYSEYETFILKIIQYVTDRVSLDTIIKDLTPLQTEIRTIAEAEEILFVIQKLMLSIVDNIAAGVDINIILIRIAYLQDQLSLAADLPVVYNDVAELISYVLDQIINRESLENIITNLTAIQTSMVAEVELAEGILRIQRVIISIIENIIQSVDINLILHRITYLQGLVKDYFH
jgi:hypothetical protein